MDEKIEKAFEVANYMATLSNQRKILSEEFNQNLFFYTNGATFKISPELICFVKILIDQDKTEKVPLVDSNGFPVLIDNLKDFFANITDQYSTALQEYYNGYTTIKSKRKIADIIDL